MKTVKYNVFYRKSPWKTMIKHQRVSGLLFALVLFMLFAPITGLGIAVAFSVFSLCASFGIIQLPFGILGVNAFSCGYGLLDTGTGRVPLQRVLKKIIIVPYFANDGTQNQITLSGGPFDAAFFSGLVNNADPSKRWYPLPFMKNALNKRAASIMKQYDDQTEAIVQQGVRKFTSIIPGIYASPQLLKTLLTFRYIDIGFYGIDKDGNLIGTINTAGFLDPIRIDQNSWDPIYNQGDDKDEPEITLAFNIHTNEMDQNLNVMSYEDMDPSANLGNIQGLIDVTPIYTNLTHAGNDLTLQLATPFGSAVTPCNDIGVTGAGQVSVKLNGTTKVYGTDYTWTEALDGSGNGTGVYVIVWAVGPSAGDTVKVAITRAGRNYQAVNTTTVTYT